MAENLGARLKHAWNAFMNRDPTEYQDWGPAYSTRPDRIQLRTGNERSILSAINTRIAIDVASTTIQHVRLDDNGRYLETIHSGLNECLCTRANIDQTGRAFLQDLASTIIDEGCAVAVPIDTDTDPRNTNSYEINTMRVGTVVQWYPESVKVRLYNDRSGRKEDVTIPKKMCAIIENPFYPIMNEPNSTFKRLSRKLSLLDISDEKAASNKMNMLVQLPYTVRSETRKRQADARRKELEEQMVRSEYGIGYIDATEKITQLNRPLENGLMAQIEYLTSTLYSQLGITKDVLEGTADDGVMTNYYDRTIEPITSAIVNEFKTKFLTKTARSQRQSILYFRDPFRLIPVTKIAEMADSLTRNEILTSNEFRQLIGMKAVDDPNADELRNKNMPIQDEMLPEGYEEDPGVYEEDAGAYEEEPIEYE